MLTFFPSEFCKMTWIEVVYFHITKWLFHSFRHLMDSWRLFVLELETLASLNLHVICISWIFFCRSSVWNFFLQITSLEIWKPPSWRQLYSQDIWRGCWGNFDRSIWPEMDEVHHRCPSRQERGGRGSLPGTSLVSIPNRSRDCLEDTAISNW